MHLAYVGIKRGFTHGEVSYPDDWFMNNQSAGYLNADAMDLRIE